MKRLRLVLIERGGLIALCAVVAYWLLAPPWVVDGDNAELSSLSVTGGIAHPSGYPLYLLWLHAMSWLPGATPAETCAHATALLGAGTLLALHAACRAWGARPLAATVACAIFGGSPLFVRLSTEAEVFVPNALLVACVLWLAARGGPLRGSWRAAALGLAAGLALSNHLTCVLVAPVGVLGVVRGAREAGRAPVAIGLAVAGLAVGLAPYLYAFVAPDAPASWGTVRDVDSLVGHFLRRDYGVGQLVAHGEPVSFVTSVVALLATMARAWLYVPFVAGAVMLGLRVGWPSEDGETRWAWALLALSWLLAGPVFVSRFDAAPEGIGAYIVQRFHLLPTMLFALPVAAAADLAPLRPRLAPLLATVGFGVCALVSLPRLARVHTPAVQALAANLLETTPAHSVVIVGTDALYYALVYQQMTVRLIGDDTVIVAWPLMARPWYRDRMAALGIVADPGPEPPEVRLASHLLATGHTVLVEPGETQLGGALPSYPYGPLARVLAKGARVPSLDDVLEENRALYERFQIPNARPGTDDEWATFVHERYALPWKALADVLASNGRAADAQHARDVANAYGPAR